MRQPNGHLGEEHYSRQNDMCQGPGAGLSLVYLRSVKEASAAGAKYEIGRWQEMRSERGDTGQRMLGPVGPSENFALTE